ncbi:MAG: sigma-70 family RNA polymerase sigma factor [Microbacteriaceae bacterium]|nr:sigma-70 family RNA polymerase sigma factor [Microbacteriaceae bacterium]
MNETPSGIALEVERRRARIAEYEALVAAEMLELRRLERLASVVEPPLHEWQREAIEAWEDAGRRGAVEAVTGTGKTRVGIAAIARAHREGRRSVVLVPSLVLRDQWLQSLRELLPQLAVVTKARPDDADWHVTITTPLHAANNALLAPGEQALLVADEMHRYGARKYRKALIEEDFPHRLGLTATRTRGDDGDAVLDEFFGPTCFELGYGRAVADELVAPFTIAFARVPFTAEERAEYEELSAQLADARRQVASEVPLEPIGEFLAGLQRLASDRGHRRSGAARWYLKLFNRRRALFSGSAQKRFALEAMLPVIRDSVGTLVFTQTKATARAVADMLADGGVEAAAVDSETADVDRLDIINGFAEGGLRALAAPVLFDEGLDLPRADLGIVLAATHRRRQMVQRFGRVLRKKPDGAIARFVVLVLAGSTEDPTAYGHEPTFADELAAHAIAAEHFDLAEPEGLPALVEFLAPGLGAGVAPFAPAAVEGTAMADRAEQRATALGAAESGPTPWTVPAWSPAPTRSRSCPGSDPVEATAAVERVRLAPLGTLAEEDDDRARRDPAYADIRISDDAAKDYRRAIGRAPLLDAEEEVELAKRIEVGLFAEQRLRDGEVGSRFERHSLERLVTDGKRAHARFVQSNLRLVVSLAKRYQHRAPGLDLLDLVQMGNEGLHKAVQKFDYRLGNKFSTYATWWIKQAVQRGIHDEELLIRVPVHMREMQAKIAKSRRRLEQQGQEVDDERLAAEAGVDAADLEKARAATHVHLDLGAFDDHLESALGIALDDPTDAVDDRLAVERIGELLPHLLDERMHDIIRARFGLDCEPQTLDRIGERFGVTRERIRQLETIALAVLRESPELRRLGIDLGWTSGGDDAPPARRRGPKQPPPLKAPKPKRRRKPAAEGTAAERTPPKTPTAPVDIATTTAAVVAAAVTAIPATRGSAAAPEPQDARPAEHRRRFGRISDSLAEAAKRLP